MELNLGDNYFTFLNWNLNSLAKENFDRAQLLEAHNSIYDYDLISICETSLDDTIEVPIELIKDYKFVQCNIQIILSMVLGCFTRTHCQLKLGTTFRLMNRLLWNFTMVEKKMVSLFCIEALPVLLVLKPLTISCPILKAYQRISEKKIHMLYLLQETSIVILFIGGLLVTQMQRVPKLTN